MVREATGMDISKLAELFEEYHLLKCRKSPDIYCPPPEDSFYFNYLSEMLLYGDEEIVVSEEDDIISGFCIFSEQTEEMPLLRKRKVLEIAMLVIRRGNEDKGIDGEMIEFVRNYAVENGCVSVEFTVPSEGPEAVICGDNGFEPTTAVMEIKLK